MPQKHPNMIVAADADALTQVAAERMTACLRRSSARLAVRLTGGSAPERLYDVPATEPCRNAFHWNHTHRFHNDDRFVPRDGPRGNFGMAQRRRFHCVPVASGRYPQELKTLRGLRACTKRSTRSTREAVRPSGQGPNKCVGQRLCTINARKLHRSAAMSRSDLLSPTIG